VSAHHWCIFIQFVQSVCSWIKYMRLRFYDRCTDNIRIYDVLHVSSRQLEWTSRRKPCYRKNSRDGCTLLAGRFWQAEFFFSAAPNFSAAAKFDGWGNSVHRQTAYNMPVSYIHSLCAVTISPISVCPKQFSCIYRITGWRSKLTIFFATPTCVRRRALRRRKLGFDWLVYGMYGRPPTRTRRHFHSLTA